MQVHMVRSVLALFFIFFLKYYTITVFCLWYCLYVIAIAHSISSPQSLSAMFQHTLYQSGDAQWAGGGGVGGGRGKTANAANQHYLVRSRQTELSC